MLLVCSMFMGRGLEGVRAPVSLTIAGIKYQP